MGSKSNDRHQFIVEIDGIKLPEEVVQLIDTALRSTLLQELASVNLNGKSVDLLREGVVASPIMAEGGGHTQGVRVKRAEM
jgi:hypothetical protein